MGVDCSVLVDRPVDLGSMSDCINPSAVRPLLLLAVTCSSSMDMVCKEQANRWFSSVSKDWRRAEQPEARLWESLPYSNVKSRSTQTGSPKSSTRNKCTVVEK
jgi:hypothetical protein